MSNHIYITYSEITGYKPSEMEIDNLISSLDKISTFNLLAMVNNFLALFPFDFEEEKFVYVQRFLSLNLLEDDVYNKLSEFVQEVSLVDRPIFHRQQVLLLMKKVLLLAQDNGEHNPDTSRETRNIVGKLCLMMSDFTVTPEQNMKTLSENPYNIEESDRILNELLAQMISVMELFNPPELSASIVRTLEYLNLSSNLFPNSFDGKTLNSFFESLTGINLERFLQLVVGVYAAVTTKELNELIENPANFNISKSNYFSNLNYRKEEIESFYNLTTTQISELKSNLENSPLKTLLQMQYDFTVFRKTPLYHLSKDTLTSIDFSFLTEKVSIGLYHTILNQLLENEVNPNKFFQHWGYVFEKYVNNIFRSVYPELSNRFHPNTFFDYRSEYESFDGIIEYPNSLIVMEYKGGLLNTKAKYSGDVNSLLNEMGKKFGYSNKESAIKQLTTKIEYLFHSNPSNRLKIRGLDFSNIQYIYPVLIANEISLDFGLANWRLKRWFEEELKTKNIQNTISVKPLLVLTIEDLEMLTPYLEFEDFTFLEFVQYYSRLEYVRFSRFLIGEYWYEPMTTIGEVFVQFRKEKKIKKRQNQKIEDKFENFIEEIISSFKDGFSS